MTTAILQARVSSSRLPGKVLRPILGRAMILRQVERIRRSRLLDHLILATSDDPSDDALAALCENEGIPCVRGSLPDVLSRFWKAALTVDDDVFVRLTGDCPLTDPEVIDDCIRLFQLGGVDYASNALEPTYPDGLDVEVMSRKALERATREATSAWHREHVTPYINRSPEIFRIAHLKQHPSRAGLRWTVDEPEDFEFVRRVYDSLYPGNPEFKTQDILDLVMREPALLVINSQFDRNQGLLRSMAAEKIQPSEGNK